MTFKFQLVIKEGKGHWGRRTRVTNEHGRVLLMEELILSVLYTWHKIVRPWGRHVEPTWHLSAQCVVQNDDDIKYCMQRIE